MVRLLAQASRLFVVSVAVSRRNGLFTVGSPVTAYPIRFLLLMRIRYVLRTIDTDEVLFVVVFSLLHKEDVEKEEAEAKKGGEDTSATSQGERREGEKDFEPGADDLD